MQKTILYLTLSAMLINANTNLFAATPAAAICIAALVAGASTTNQVDLATATPKQELNLTNIVYKNSPRAAKSPKNIKSVKPKRISARNNHSFKTRR